MNRVQGKLLLYVIILLIAALCAWTLVPAARQKPTAKPPSFLGPITADTTGWAAAQLDEGRDLYLSSNYLFQNAKLRTQKVLMDYETHTLLPTLMEAMDALKQTGLQGHSLAFVEAARKLLDPDAAVDLSVAADVTSRVEGFMNDPRNIPRGHYTTSEELQRYFRGMQFLSKATFDVDVNKEWFRQSLYMLFPFDAVEPICRVLSDPANAALKERLDLIASFYSFLVGPPDMPTFRELLKDNLKIDRSAILAYARAKGIPRINKAMGVGVQFFGERFTPTQQVVDALSQTFLAQDPDVNRQKAFETLRMKHVLQGLTKGKKKVAGLIGQKSVPPGSRDSYYGLCVSVIETMMAPEQGDYGLNGAASALTALAEQTILVTKQSALIIKGAPLVKETKKKPGRIWVQRGIEKFLKQLSQAEKKLYEACGIQWNGQPYDYLSEASRSGKPFQSDSEKGIALTQFAGHLALDPTVIVDAFFYSVRSDRAFLQWAIGPFKAAYDLPNKTKAFGMELVFFEGWNDELIPGAQKPITNEEWREQFAHGQYKLLHTYAPLNK
ncbi:MAG: DUF3160 domain-containing protein [Desulfomonilaceae bacterium]